MSQPGKFQIVSLLAILAILGNVAHDRATAGEIIAPSDEPKADREAVQAALDSFVEAFGSRDASALAELWTAGAEYHNLDGLTVQGREDLERIFTSYFARTPEVSAQLKSDSIRFLSDSAALAEGSVTVRRGPVVPESRARYRALLLREGSRWLLAELTEMEEPGPSLADLEWLVGEWRSETGQGAEIQTTYSWAPSHKFLHAQFTIKEKDLTLSGFQVIGIEPATETIHAWTFEGTGGVGDADWTQDGDHWILDAAGTLTDGRTLTETNILRRVDNNTFTWQSIDRMLEETELPDLAPVKVSRVKAVK